MKTVSLSETAFAALERYRLRKGVSRKEALEVAIKRIEKRVAWEAAVINRHPKAQELSETEANALAVEAVRATRRQRS
jgi:hypothetical protein